MVFLREGTVCSDCRRWGLRAEPAVIAAFRSSKPRQSRLLSVSSWVYCRPNWISCGAHTALSCFYPRCSSSSRRTPLACQTLATGGKNLDTAHFRSHFEATLVFTGGMVVLAGSVGAGFSLLIGVGGMLSAVKSAPFLASLGPLMGVLLMPVFYLCAAVISLLPAAVAGVLFFLAAASSILCRVPTPLVPFVCAAFGYMGVEVVSGVLDGGTFKLNVRVFGSLLGLVSGAALFWLPVLRPMSNHLRKAQHDV